MTIRFALNTVRDDDLLAEATGALLNSADPSVDVREIGFSMADLDVIIATPEPKEHRSSFPPHERSLRRSPPFPFVSLAL